MAADMAGETGFEDFFYSAPDGLQLHARVYGGDNRGALPVVCLAGLTRNARDFHELALHLSCDTQVKRKVVAFDYRGRGHSAHDPDWQHYDPLVEAQDVMAGTTALGIEHAAFIGTSRGGLIIFALAAMRPALLKAVVLNDIGPVIEGAGLAQIRAYLHEAPKPKSIAEAIAIQKKAQGNIFTALSDADWERATRAFYREDDGSEGAGRGKRGGPVPDFDPALLKTLTQMDFSKPLPVLWPQFMALAEVPVLAIRGANSSLLSAATLAEMAERHPRLETVTVAGQGHAPFLETAGLPGRISDFIDRADRNGA